jgi:hypothetical protein
MRHFHSFLYFIGAGALIAGIIDCVSISLGGSEGNHLFAIGFTLLSVGSGLRYSSSGFTPPRASFMLLGLAGVLPLLSGMAPLSALFATLLYLPLRALGANLSHALGLHSFNLSLLIIGTLLGANVVPGIAVGIPGFISVWAVTGILQRYLLINKVDNSNDTASRQVSTLLAPFAAGVAIALMLLLLLPYATVFDFATTADNTIRGNTILFIFALSWLTLAAGLAETFNKTTFRISSALLAFMAIYSLGFIEDLSGADIYSRVMQNSKILWLSNSSDPILPEGNPIYIPVVTTFSFAIPVALLAIILRCMSATRQKLSATVCGIAAAFIIIAIAPRDIALDGRLGLTIGSFAAALLLSFNKINRSKKMAATAVAISIFGGLNLAEQCAQPTIQLLAKGNYDWYAEEGSSTAQLTHIDRLLSNSGKQYYFDGRSPITPLEDNHRSFAESDLFIESFVADNHNPISVERPEELINSSGDHSLIKLYATAQYNSRRSLLRHELFRQASVRLSKDGICVLRIASDDLSTGVAPQIAQSFRDIYADTKFFVFSESLTVPYLIFVGSNSAMGDLQYAAASEFILKENTNIDSWLLHGPWRPVNYLLGDRTKPVLNPKVSRQHRAARVLNELQQFQQTDAESLLEFFAQHLQAQSYSVHDTYLDDNPLATETTDSALASLLAITARHPNSLHLKALWTAVSVSLIELREVSWLETYFNQLQQLGWNDDFVLISLTHAALETLDFELATTLCLSILERSPQHSAALALLELARSERQVPRDGHVGHNH